ncbi:hypothetical protein [Streptomyces lonarensis]|uniref:hypothetical protein n=1 Tax=Streptomyces lonarensis TaxID=700599 RepID=UPI0030C6A4BF
MGGGRGARDGQRHGGKGGGEERGGRALLTQPPGNDPGTLRDHALPTAAALLETLHRTAADRTRDTFGRLRATDPELFARAWLAVALYTDELDRALCAEAWTDDPS